MIIEGFNNTIDRWMSDLENAFPDLKLEGPDTNVVSPRPTSNGELHSALPDLKDEMTSAGGSDINRPASW